MSKAYDDPKAAQLRSSFLLGEFRTIDQDVGFGIRQIVDIANKALSAGINDNNTAVAALDHLSTILCRLSRRDLTRPADYAAHDRVRWRQQSFQDFLRLGLDEARHCAAGNVEVMLQLLRVLQRVALAGQDRDARAAVLEQAREIAAAADGSVESRYDRSRLDRRLAELREALEAGPMELPSLPEGP